MNMLTLETIVIASTVLEFSPLLQSLKSLRKKDVEDISVYTFVAISLLSCLWLYYGITILNWPIIVGNGIKLFSNVSVIAIYYHYHRKRTKKHH
jgi:MtN3 and saliva related transmembrane protein